MASSKDSTRSLLKSSVVALLAEAGFDAADNAALETLIEITQACKSYRVIITVIG